MLYMGRIFVFSIYLMALNELLLSDLLEDLIVIVTTIQWLQKLMRDLQ